MIRVDATFCYLGDMLCSGGGCDSAIVARCCVVWGKLRELFPVLTTRHLSPRIQGKVYEACVRSAMPHGSETWGPKELELRRHRRNDRAMIQWICGIKGGDETPSASLQLLIGIEEITSALPCRRFRRNGHVQHATFCIKSITKFPFHNTRKKRRPRKRCSERVKTDVDKCGLVSVDQLDRDAWESGVRYSLVLPTPLNRTWTAP